MAIGFGTTIKQINKLLIKERIDGVYGVYSLEQRFTCMAEFVNLAEAIVFCRNYKH